ncbi:MAG: glycosyltransferase family 2 protein, partial [Verrucomicrobiaceae bacterium]
MQLSGIDLLSLPLIAREGVSRERSKFQVEEAWVLADFGKLQLKPGWWRIDCQGGPPNAEVRLSSDQDPLIVIPVKAMSARIHIGDAAGYYVTLLISPWPGTYSFAELRLRRLGFMELAKMAIAAVGRLAHHQKPFTVLRRAIRRLKAGQALGLSVSAPQDFKEARSVGVNSSDQVGAAATHLLSEAITLNARAGDRVHKHAAAIVRHALDQRVQLKAVYADVIEGGALVPQPEWDPELDRSGAFDNIPIFTQADTSITSVADAIQKWGIGSVARIPLPLIERKGSVSTNVRSCISPQLERLPLVSIVIPTKFRMDLLEKCIQGLIDKTGYSEIEIIVVDNGITDASFPRLLDPARAHFAVQIVEDAGPFNFSRLVNTGVRKA